MEDGGASEREVGGRSDPCVHGNQLGGRGTRRFMPFDPHVHGRRSSVDGRANRKALGGADTQSERTHERVVPVPARVCGRWRHRRRGVERDALVASTDTKPGRLGIPHARGLTAHAVPPFRQTKAGLAEGGSFAQVCGQGRRKT